MPFCGYGFNCEDPVCPLDCRNPHCHPKIHSSPVPETLSNNASYIPRPETPIARSSNPPISEVHKPVEKEREERDPAQSRGVQPSLAEGGKADLSRIPGLELTNRGTFSFGGTRMGASNAEEKATEVKQAAEFRQSAEAMLAYPAPANEIARASQAAQILQSASTAEEDFTRSALLAQQSRADQVARERGRDPRDLPAMMNQLYEDRLKETARKAQARMEEETRARELDRAADRMMLTVRQNESAARWAEIQARMEGRRLQRQSNVPTRNQEFTREAMPEAVPEQRRLSLTTRVSELPPIHEHTAFCIHEENGVANENTPIEPLNTSPDAEERENVTRNVSTEADDGTGFKLPTRVFTGDSGFGGGEDDMGDLRRPSRVLTGDSAFASGDNSRSQSRKRDKDTLEEESD